MKFALFSAAAVCSLVAAMPALAQEGQVEEVIVTARAGATEQRRVEASYAITTVPQATLRLQSPPSVAEVLKNVPGFWVEASGGVGGANIRARGIPIEGTAALSLQEDGLPVQHDGGLGFLNSDFSFRYDEGVERVEVVRGGPSSIFASYAPGGVINFITRKPTQAFEGVAKVEVGDYGYGRADLWMGAVVDGVRLGLGGFYRNSQGVRDPGFTADDGGQFRFSIGKDLGDRGSIDFNIKHIDDNTIFYLPVPLTFDSKGDTAEVPGFDALYGTFAGPETRNLTLRTNSGPFPFDLSRGADLKLTQYTLDGRYELGAGFELIEKLRYKDATLVRAGLFPNTPLTATARIAQAVASVPAALGPVTGRLVYANGLQPFDTAGQNGNGLVMDAFVRQQDIKLSEWINDTRLQRRFDFGGQSHDVAIGFYYADVEERFRQQGAAVLIDVQDQARLLSLTAVNAAGQTVATFTENGFSRYGTQFNNAEGKSKTVALYASDEWRLGSKLRIDLGFRWERIEFTGRNERSATVNLNQSATAADDSAIVGTGVYDLLDREYDDWGATAGVNYQLQPDFGVFARYTKAFRLPSLGDLITSPTRVDARLQGIDLAEGGVKFQRRLFSLYATGFYTGFDSQGFTETRFDQATNAFVSRTEFASTKAYGIEVEGMVRPVSWFDLTVTGTLQNPTLGDFIFNERVAKVAGACPATTDTPTAGADCLRQRDFSGNQQIRTPKISGRIVPGVTLLDGKLRVQGELQYYGKRYSDIANTLTIPSYYLVNMQVRYDFSERLSLFGNVTNLTNEIGLTEGNPRAGQFISGEAGARYYLARPELGRAFRASLLYRW